MTVFGAALMAAKRTQGLAQLERQIENFMENNPGYNDGRGPLAHQFGGPLSSLDYDFSDEEYEAALERVMKREPHLFRDPDDR